MRKRKTANKFLSIALSLALFASCIPISNVNAQTVSDETLEAEGDFTTCKHTVV